MDNDLIGSKMHSSHVQGYMTAIVPGLNVFIKIDFRSEPWFTLKKKKKKPLVAFSGLKSNFFSASLERALCSAFHGVCGRSVNEA